MGLILFKLIIGVVWLSGLFFISFVETPLKFKAKSVTTNIGVEIGSIIFTALTRIELFLSICLFFLLYFSSSTIIEWSVYTLVTLMLLTQMLLYLPKLKEQAKRIINGKDKERIFSHKVYVCLEVLKVCLITVFIWKQVLIINSLG